MPSKPNRRRKRFGTYMAELRDAAGQTHEDAAELLQKKQPSISKMENGYFRLAHAEIVALCGAYGATDKERKEALLLWKEAGQDSRPIQGSAAMPVKFVTFLRNEDDATLEQELNRIVVPGLLQTAAYAKAVNIAGHRIVGPNVKDSRATSARLKRQELLRKENPLQFHALIDEAAIRRVVGGRVTMVEAMTYLRDVAQLDNVTVQIVPFNVGAYGPMSGSFAVLSYPEPDPATVYCEFEGSGEWVDAPNDVEKYQETFQEIVSELALSPAESIALIENRIREL